MPRDIHRGCVRSPYAIRQSFTQPTRKKRDPVSDYFALTDHQRMCREHYGREHRIGMTIEVKP